ncbi:hypothetical protein [Sphingobium sp. D43FB]|uniref:hypothetical protein n=1 Tax=Sphingobium sp. D43FB TaxID=2017595 RepID=UPI000BB53A16|nr:hypothetical protein [Sphingobium sp. D43FB]PBN41391.1 hypothetical protein SxD43FB_22100 [Sphingobium sp. D43FB]
MRMVRFEVEFDVVDAALDLKADNAQRAAAANAFEKALAERVFQPGFLPSELKLNGAPSIQRSARDAQID